MLLGEAEIASKPMPQKSASRRGSGELTNLLRDAPKVLIALLTDLLGARKPLGRKFL